MKAVLIVDSDRLDDISIKSLDDVLIDYQIISKDLFIIDRNIKALRPLPSKKDVTVKSIEDIQSCSITEVADNISARIILKTDEIFALGWNACLEEIIGETE